jgi:hypothetical protein
VGAVPGITERISPTIPRYVRSEVIAWLDPVSGMTVRKLPSGKWFAELKAGRTYVGDKSFATKRQAQAWLDRERRKRFA